MKSRYLDIRNCHVLLPSGNGLPFIAKLDECLEGINNKNGLIDTLLKQNEKTLNKTTGSKRLCNSPLEVVQVLYIKDRTINTRAAIRNNPGPAQLHIVLMYENEMVHKTLVPLQYLLKNWGVADDGYQCYIHSISDNIQSLLNYIDSDSYYYVGITGRNWLLRLEEHIRAMRQGDRRLFYEVWREKYGKPDMLFTSSLREINLTYHEAMNWEEMAVDKIANDQWKLNMIPGGFKGLKLLHASRIIKNIDITLEERDKAISEYLLKNPRKGIPNPFIAELWKDDGYYQKVIEGREKTLTAEQVRKIRELYNTGMSILQITQEVDALNELQVKNVISGKTYSRIV